MSSVLVEDLGPIGRRRVRVTTIVAIAIGIGLIVWALFLLAGRGQLEAAKWTELFQPATLEYLLAGLLNTFRAALTAMVGSIIIGFLFALARLARASWVRGLAVAYVEFFRSIPLLLAIFGVYFGFSASGMDLGIFWSLVLALVLYNSAVLSEIFRAGIKSLDRGQTEAAQAIGMRYWPMMRIVILPQAVRRMIPAIVAQLATLTKDVSLGFVISYPEIVSRGEATSRFPGAEAGNFQAYVFVGVIYFLIIWALARLAARLEVQQRKSMSAAKMDVGAGLEDIAALGEDADEKELEDAEREGRNRDEVADAQARAHGEAEDQGARLNQARKGDRD